MTICHMFFIMVPIGRKTIAEFGVSYPQSRTPLAVWEKIISNTYYKNFNELKLTFPSADYVCHQYTVFNISGNKFRIISEIDYSANVVNVKRVYTH